MFPIWLKKPNHNYKILHMHFMYWSLIGLYMGFVAEIFTRIPGTPFYSMVAIASSTVFLLGVMGFKHKMPEWERRFGNHKSVTTTA